MSQWIGFAVSVTCGDPLGCYQGTIVAADGGTITLTKAFRNGFPYPKEQVTLNAADIKDLKIIEAASMPSEQKQHSTVAVTKHKKSQRATVCETLQNNPSSSGEQGSKHTARGGSAGNAGGAGGPARSKPIDIQASRASKNNNHSGSNGASGSTPRARCAPGGGSGGVGAWDRGGGSVAHGAQAMRRRNEACFGSDASDPALQSDFDFEKNLALFDKQGLWEQMRHAKPDLVRQAEEGASGGGGGGLGLCGKFRHDENILGGGGAEPLAPRIIVPEHARAHMDLVTDEGVSVPTVMGHVRRRLWELAAGCGLLPSLRTLLARATADVALRLVGGGRRLDPRNAHQAPRVAVLVGQHRVGAVGVCVARLLASHGVRALVHVTEATAGGGGAGGGGGPGDELAAELAALALDEGGALVTSLAHLPAPDLVLLALHDPAQGEGGDDEPAAVSWARGCRAGVVALEPPAAGWRALACRAAVTCFLPAPPAASLGRVYLANVAAPRALFALLDIRYSAPFGGASVLALHPKDP